MNQEITDAVRDASVAYDRTAQAYDAITSPFSSAVMYPKIISAAEEFLGTLQNANVLDIGCGSGALMQMLKERGAIAQGVDIASSFLNLARSRGHLVTKASMHALPFETALFHGVVSNFAINYLPPAGQRLALREAFRILRPGGVIVFSCMHPSLIRTGNYFEPLTRKTLDMLGQVFTLHILDWPELANAVIESGFVLRRLMDAEVPEDLETMAAAIENPAARRMAQSFAIVPYGMFFVATKPH